MLCCWVNQCARRVMCSGSAGRWHSSGVFRTPRPHPTYLFICLFLSCVLCNKTEIISMVLTWVPWVIFPNYWNWDYCGTLTYAASQKYMWLGDHLNLQLVSEVKTVLWRTEVLICEFCTKSRRLVPKLNCSTLHLGPNNEIFFVTFCSDVYLTFFILVTFHLLFWDVLVQFLSYQFGCLLFLFKNLIAVTRI